MALGLWRESFATADDVLNLFQRLKKTRPKQAAMASYLEKMSKMLWVSENYLFHALAMIKRYENNRLLKKSASFTPEDPRGLASLVVLGVLAIAAAPQSSSDLEGFNGSVDDGHKRLATMLQSSIIPTRESLQAEIVGKQIVDQADPLCKRLFELFQIKFAPLSLCNDAKAILDELEARPGGVGECGSGEYSVKEYVKPLKKALFIRSVQQLSKVYSCIGIERFESILDILPWVEAEQLLVEACLNKVLPVVAIDHVRGCVTFPTDDHRSSFGDQLERLAGQLTTVCTHIKKDENKRKIEEEKDRISSRLVTSLNAEQERVKDRRHEIETKIREREKLEQEAVTRHERLMRERRLDELNAERQRQDEEKKKRDEERHTRMQAEVEERELVARIARLTAAGRTIEVDGKVDKESLERAEAAQEEKIRLERIKLRKAEAKRVDHFARAMREISRAQVQQFLRDIGARETEVEKTYHDEVHAMDDYYDNLRQLKSLGEELTEHVPQLQLIE
eukprot:Filipodium_phascolosomae@DN8063_c0_g1_i1.p1